MQLPIDPAATGPGNTLALINNFNELYGARPGWARPKSISGIGDSIVARCSPNGDLNVQTVAQSYTQDLRAQYGRSWLQYGAFRSNLAWYVFDYLAGFSGATSQTILNVCLPALLNYPNGLPDMCVVLAGTNDVGQSIPATTTLGNLRQMYVALLAAGVVPIACTIPPNSTSVTNAAQLNMGIVRLAREFNIPLFDFYTCVAGAGGAWSVAAWTDDNTHPSPLGSCIAGYGLYQCLLPYTKGSSRISTHMVDLGAGVTTYARDPNFQTFTGVINTASSYPNVGWGAPGTTAMSTLNNSGAGVEPGVGFTMAQGSPAIAGQAASYIGNSWSIAGNGANTLSISGPSIACSAGDRIALSFRMKMIAGEGNASCLQGGLYLNFGGRNLLGYLHDGSGTAIAANAAAQIGNEAAYSAGDYYGEMIVQPADAGNIALIYRLNIQAGGSSNNGDSFTVANMRYVNLTKAGILVP